MKIAKLLLLLGLFVMLIFKLQTILLARKDTHKSLLNEFKEYQAQNQLLVATTVAPLTNIISNIAGERIKVKGLIPEGTDSHTYELRTSDAEVLAKANLIVVNGLHLETPTQRLSRLVKQKSTKVYALGEQTITQEQWLYDFSFPKHEGKPNPHLWVNPKYAATYAKLSHQWLSQLDPTGKDYYDTNLKNYLQRLDELDKVTRAVIASIPPENRQLLTYHDSWAYWAKEYNFKIIGAVQPSDFQQPSDRDVARLIAQIQQTKVPALFGSEVYPSYVVDLIATETKVKVADTSDDELPGEGSANAMENRNPRHTYIGMMAQNLQILAENLGGKPELVNSLNTANVVGSTASAKARN